MSKRVDAAAKAYDALVAEMNKRNPTRPSSSVGRRDMDVVAESMGEPGARTGKFAAAPRWKK
jgi:hypothetical protein